MAEDRVTRKKGIPKGRNLNLRADSLNPGYFCGKVVPRKECRGAWSAFLS